MINQNSNQRFIVAGLLLAILMAAMDNTIVATAMGTIVSDLGGFENLSGLHLLTWSQQWRECLSLASFPICMGANSSSFSGWSYS